METETKSDTTVPRHGMSTEEQRIKIAEARGCRDIRPWGVYADLFGYEVDNKTHTHSRIPDYLNDLNAMHEEWKRLDHNQRVQFSEHLNQIVASLVKANPDPDVVWFEGLAENATAAQRAEAFLKTLGLWKP
jgi:hypothetical protein